MRVICISRVYVCIRCARNDQRLFCAKGRSSEPEAQCASPSSRVDNRCSDPFSVARIFSSSSADLKAMSSVKVAVRVRPFNAREIGRAATCVIAMDGKTTCKSVHVRVCVRTRESMYGWKEGKRRVAAVCDIALTQFCGAFFNRFFVMSVGAALRVYVEGT